MCTNDDVYCATDSWDENMPTSCFVVLTQSLFTDTGASNHFKTTLVWLLRMSRIHSSDNFSSSLLVFLRWLITVRFRTVWSVGDGQLYCWCAWCWYFLSHSWPWHSFFLWVFTIYTNIFSFFVVGLNTGPPVGLMTQVPSVSRAFSTSLSSLVSSPMTINVDSVSISIGSLIPNIS